MSRIKPYPLNANPTLLSEVHEDRNRMEALPHLQVPSPIYLNHHVLRVRPRSRHQLSRSPVISEACGLSE